MIRQKVRIVWGDVAIRPEVVPVKDEFAEVGVPCTHEFRVERVEIAVVNEELEDGRVQRVWVLASDEEEGNEGTEQANLVYSFNRNRCVGRGKKRAEGAEATGAALHKQ